MRIIGGPLQQNFSIAMDEDSPACLMADRFFARSSQVIGEFTCCVGDLNWWSPLADLSLMSDGRCGQFVSGPVFGARFRVCFPGLRRQAGFRLVRESFGAAALGSRKNQRSTGSVKYVGHTSVFPR